MDLKMFIKFPGILITIGAILLIISIIIIIIAYKKEKKAIDATKLSTINEVKEDNEINEYNEDNGENENINYVFEDEDLDKTKIFPTANLKDTENDIPKIEIKEIEESKEYVEEVENEKTDSNEDTMDAFVEEFGSYEEKPKPTYKNIEKKEPQKYNYDDEEDDDDDIELL